MDSIPVVILTMVLLMAVVMDLRSSRIPNWLTFPAMGFALAGHAWLNNMDGILFSLAGLGMGLGALFLVLSCGGIGAGDVKLMAAIGAFVGVYGVLSCAWLAMIHRRSLRHRCDVLPVGFGGRGSTTGLCRLRRGSWLAEAPGVGN